MSNMTTEQIIAELRAAAQALLSGEEPTVGQLMGIMGRAARELERLKTVLDDAKDGYLPQ